LTVAIVGGRSFFSPSSFRRAPGWRMEFAVGVMLVVLGLLNLTGLNQWIRDNVAAGFRPASTPIPMPMVIMRIPMRTAMARRTMDPEDRTRRPGWTETRRNRLYQMARPFVVGTRLAWPCAWVCA